jgi:hypothetical protein
VVWIVGDLGCLVEFFGMRGGLDFEALFGYL